jgi:hypothetical protein
MQKNRMEVREALAKLEPANRTALLREAEAFVSAELTESQISDGDIDREALVGALALYLRSIVSVV